MREKEHAQSKTGFLTVIVGETGTGKTCIAKEIFDSSKHGAVFDFQDEYGLPGLQTVGDKLPCKFSLHPAYYEVEDYVKVFECSKEHTFIIEECTGLIDNDYFKSNKGKRMIRRILSKRHTQAQGGGNNYIMLFHALNNVPKMLWTYVDFLFIFPTAEESEIKNPVIKNVHDIVMLNKDKRIKFKTWEISDYRILVRTNHGKNNLDYIKDFKDKIYEPTN